MEMYQIMEARERMWVKEMGKPVSRLQEIGIQMLLQVFGSQQMETGKMGIGKMRPPELDN